MKHLDWLIINLLNSGYSEQQTITIIQDKFIYTEATIKRRIEIMATSVN